MPGRVLLRWVPPAPVREGSGKAARLREWNVPKILQFLQDELGPRIEEAFDAELVIVPSKIAEIRPEHLAVGFKVADVRAAVGEMLTTVMEGFEGEEYLLEVAEA